MDFSGGPVVKTLHCQCRWCQFDPWLGNEDPTCHSVWPKDKWIKSSCSGHFFRSSLSCEELNVKSYIKKGGAYRVG